MNADIPMNSKNEPMNLDNYFSEYRRLLAPEGIGETMHALKVRIEQVRAEGRKLIFAGNGASASIASHLATDFSKQGGVRAMAFNDANLITALGNDCGYENWIAKALELYGDRGDLLVLVSSSGKSPNVLAAARRARELGISVVSCTGFAADNPLGQLADLNFWVDSRSYNIVECLHMVWLTGVCDLLIGSAEYSVSGSGAKS
jgi:D-sedoheptulose 7-phosphate isomerase